MEKENDYRFIPTSSWDKYCFGCGPDNPKGLRMKFYTDEETLFSWITVPEHLCGWNRLVHGGIIATILDEIMGWTAIQLLRKVVLTKSITIDFVKPTFINTELRAEGRIIKSNGNREIIIGASIYDEKGCECAKSSGTFTLFSPEDVKSMGIMDDEFLEEFEGFVGE